MVKISKDKSIKKRRENAYEKIAKRFKVKPSYVQSILKIGRVNPMYFERISKGRMAVYVAESKVKSEEKKELQEVPAIKPIVYFSQNLEPVGNFTQVPGETETGSVDDKHEPVLEVIQRLSKETISFRCPCGCSNTFIINHNTLNHERQEKN
jgi:hypothetical protein